MSTLALPSDFELNMRAITPDLVGDATPAGCLLISRDAHGEQFFAALVDARQPPEQWGDRLVEAMLVIAQNYGQEWQANTELAVYEDARDSAINAMLEGFARSCARLGLRCEVAVDRVCGH